MSLVSKGECVEELTQGVVAIGTFFLNNFRKKENDFSTNRFHQAGFLEFTTNLFSYQIDLLTCRTLTFSQVDSYVLVGLLINVKVQMDNSFFKLIMSSYRC